MALQANALCAVSDITARGSSQADAVIEDAINAISDRLESYCARAFLQAIYTDELYQGTGGRELPLRNYPIAASPAPIVLIGDVPVTDFIIIGDDPKQKDILYRRGGWPRLVASWGDLTYDPAPEIADYSIKVTYTAGFAVVPAELKLACIQEAMRELARPTNPHLVEEKTVGGWTEKWADKTAAGLLLSPDTRSAIRKYKRVLYA